jgi:hypothetical protein
MNRWARFDNLVGRQVNKTFGEPILISPRKSVPKRGAVADPDREPRTIVGVVSISAGDQPIEGSRRGTEITGHTTLATSQARVWLSAVEAGKIGFRPIKDDAVSLPDRPGVTYSIVRVDPTDIGDMTLHLVPESQQ